VSCHWLLRVQVLRRFSQVGWRPACEHINLREQAQHLLSLTVTLLRLQCQTGWWNLRQGLRHSSFQPSPTRIYRPARQEFSGITAVTHRQTSMTQSWKSAVSLGESMQIRWNNYGSGRVIAKVAYWEGFCATSSRWIPVLRCPASRHCTTPSIISFPLDSTFWLRSATSGMVELSVERCAWGISNLVGSNKGQSMLFPLFTDTQ